MGMLVSLVMAASPLFNCQPLNTNLNAPAACVWNAAADIPPAQTQPLKTIIIDNYYPYTFLNQQGQPGGFTVDLMNTVAKVMGFEVEIKVDTWQHAMEALQSGAIDFLPMMAYSAERDQAFDFSAPHTIAYDAFFTRTGTPPIRSIDDLRGKAIIVMEGDQAHNYLRTLDFIKPEQLILVNSLPDALRLLAAGKGDTALMPKLVGLLHIQNLHLTSLELSPIVVEAYNRPFSFAVKNGNQALLERLSQGLNIIKSTGQYQAIYDKWFGGLEPSGIPLATVLTYAGGVGLVAVIIGSLLLVWSFSLRKQVAQRTRHLEAEIQERKRAEEALRTTHELFSQFMHHSPIYTYIKEVTPTRSLVLQASENYQEMIGIPGSEMIGKTMEELFPPEFAAKMTADDWAVVSGGAVLKLDEELNGKYYTTIKYPILQGDRTLLGGYTIDITDRKKALVEQQRLLTQADQSRQALLSVIEDQKKAEDQIRQLNADLERRVADRTARLAAANQELEAFSYSVSHDLRSPLRALDGFSATLLEGYSDKLDEQGLHFLTRIQEASRRMGQLINDLLSLSQVTRSEFSRQRVDLSELASEIAGELQAQDPQRQVEFDISSNLVAEGDPQLLKIVLENLLNNAYKFTSQRTQARIRVGSIEQTGKRVYFVRDNGAGFNMDYADKLFAPFQRLHGVNEFPGTGIGLVTVQRIITRHGGQIWPEAAVDKGATFYFTLEGNDE